MTEGALHVILGAPLCRHCGWGRYDKHKKDTSIDYYCLTNDN